jgi:hypothetical protein
VRDGGVLYAVIGNRRVPVVDDDTSRFRPEPTAGPRTDSPPELQAAIEAAREYRAMLLGLPHVVAVRAGYKFINGEIQQIPAVVVAVDQKVESLPRDKAVPPVLPNGVVTDVTIADPVERLTVHGAVEAAMLPIARSLIEEIQDQHPEAEALEVIPQITYEPPAGARLDPVTGAMTITCHVSPDAGWAVLRPFLEATRQEITLGMYDFTAPHVYQVVRTLLRDTDVTWRQTLGPRESLPGENDVDSTKADDKTEEAVVRGLERVAADRFDSVFARVGAGQTFASAYHIKVAVRDRMATWLSSGNWQSSNQPAIDFLAPTADRHLIPRYNREWHAVVESEDLAECFRRYLQHDFETAEEAPESAEAVPLALPDLLAPVDELLEEERAAVGLEVFPPARFVFGRSRPLTIQPILTPDNYAAVVAELLRHRPAERLYFQNQSLNPVLRPTAEWAELMQLLADYSQDNALDVRIIFRNIGPIRKKLESLQAAGFNMDRVKVQSGCHTKGIVIDSKTVLLGSHNWTNQGIQANRDASLLIHDPDIARYYERVFLHDWERLAKTAIREEAMPVPANLGAEAAALDAGGLMRIPWSAWMEE